MNNEDNKSPKITDEYASENKGVMNGCNTGKTKEEGQLC